MQKLEDIRVMRHVGRFVAFTVAVVVLLGVVVVGLVVVSAAALPLVVTAVVVLFGLVAGVGSRLVRRPGRRRGWGSPVAGAGDDLGGVGAAAAPVLPESEWVTQWDSGPPASAVPFVRERLAPVLAEWGLTPEASETIFLVVTELVSNAVEHARSPVRLIVRIVGQTVRVEVHDAESEHPRLQPQDPWRVRGRGLQIVETLSVRWGCTSGSLGKIVWAEVSTEWTD